MCKQVGSERNWATFKIIMRNFLEKSFHSKKILICCGSGGVGKTTMACAIAATAALEHKKNVLVLTIDPAKRLAEALGFKGFSEEVQKISLGSADYFHAAMLQEKKTFDRLIERFSPSEKVKEEIFKNPIYQHVSEGLSGIHEYMACIKLYEFYESKKYDLIILDTPPMRKALDFLEAPERISDFFDAKIFHWFLKPYFKAADAGFKFLFSTSSLALKLIERFSGMEVLQTLHSFFLNFEEMFVQFQTHALHIEELLKSEKCGFILVTSPNPIHFQEISEFSRELRNRNLNCVGIIMNQVFPIPIIDHWTALKSNLTEEVKSKYSHLLECVDKFDTVAIAQNKAVEVFLKKIGMNKNALPIQKLPNDVTDIAGLRNISLFLRSA